MYITKEELCFLYELKDGKLDGVVVLQVEK